MEDKPVTVIVRRRVHPESLAAFEKWQRGAMAMVATFEGHLGTEVIQPEDAAHQDFVIIFRFAKAAQLEAWERSAQRAQLLAEVEPMTVRASVEKISGLEYWFALAGQKAPPPRHKMAFVTVLAIYPLVMFFVPFMGGLLHSLPHAAATLVTACTMVAMMTWIVMPLMTRLFARWLFAEKLKG